MYNRQIYAINKTWIGYYIILAFDAISIINILYYSVLGTNWAAKFIQLLVNDTDEEADLVRKMPSPFFGLETAIRKLFNTIRCNIKEINSLQ